MCPQASTTFGSLECAESEGIVSVNWRPEVLGKSSSVVSSTLVCLAPARCISAMGLKYYQEVDEIKQVRSVT